MSTYRYALALLGAMTLAGCGSSSPEYNVLLITVDTTRADYVGCLGGDPRNTPNMDALAARSVLFTNAASETNVTNPSHISILTGRRAIDHGVISNVVPVPEDVVTLPAHLGSMGYQTAGFIAADHLQRFPEWDGFDECPPVPGVLDANQIVDQAVGFLRERDTERPFFLWTHYFDAHTLYQPPADIARAYYSGNPAAGDGPPINEHPYFAKADNQAIIQWLETRSGPVRDIEYGRAMYSAEIHFMDREIGRLLDELDAQGLTENTIVVLVADHGESLEEHGLWYDHKGLYEQQLRIPLIVHVPGMKPGKVDAFASTIDVAPTVVEALGIEAGGPMNGLSLIDAMRGNPRSLVERDTFVHQNAHNHTVAVRSGDWKLVHPINKNHKVIPGEPQLFNLEEDPGELVNLHGGEAERAQAMRRLLDPWIALGKVTKGSSIALTPEDKQALKDLGYAGDVEDE